MIAGVYAGVTVKERENGVYHASVRTKEPVNAAAICEKFGGGGHKYAAGCDDLGYDKEEAVRRIVAAAERQLAKVKLI
jgi:phosphoesterase RecJ-like protein